LFGGTAALTPIFRVLGSYEPVWADAWIFVGSLLATFGMAKGWVEFWLTWVAVDIVGVPLLVDAGYYASAFMYLFYGMFTLAGFFVWLRVRNRRAADPQARVTVETEHLVPTLERRGVLAQRHPASGPGLEPLAVVRILSGLRISRRRSPNSPRRPGFVPTDRAPSASSTRACTISARRSSRRPQKCGWPASTSPSTRPPKRSASCSTTSR